MRLAALISHDLFMKDCTKQLLTSKFTEGKAKIAATRKEDQAQLTPVSMEIDLRKSL
jgi:hypothetical protein